MLKIHNFLLFFSVLCMIVAGRLMLDFNASLEAIPMSRIGEALLLQTGSYFILMTSSLLFLLLSGVSLNIYMYFDNKEENKLKEKFDLMISELSLNDEEKEEMVSFLKKKRVYYFELTLEEVKELVKDELKYETEGIQTKTEEIEILTNLSSKLN